MSRPVHMLSQLVGFARRQSQALVAMGQGDTPVASALPRLRGPALARQRLREAAEALLEAGRTPAETFHALRLELNRLEQGGMRPVEPATPRSVAAEGSGGVRAAPQALPEWIDDGMPNRRSRAARRARRVVGQRLQRAVGNASAWIR